MPAINRRTMMMSATAATAGVASIGAMTLFAATPEPTPTGHLDARDFGLDPKASDNGPALRKALAAASSQRKTLVIPAGRYLFDSFDPSGTQAFCVVLQDPDLNLDVECMGELAFGPTTAATAETGSLIRIEARGQSQETRFRWVGGSFDMTAARRSDRGLGAISIGPKVWSAILRDIRFDGGEGRPGADNSIGAGGGDQYLFTKETEFLVVDGCEFRGAADCAIYINADENPARTGGRAVIQSCKFTHCGNAVAIKRRFEQLTFANCFVEDGGNGVFFGTTGTSKTNNGRRANIIANVFRRIEGNPIDIKNSDYVSVTGNTILDYRRQIRDPGTATRVKTGNFGGAVKLTGATHCEIVGNSMGYEKWTAPDTGGSEAVGVAIFPYDQVTPPLPSTDNIVANNVIVGARRTVFVDASCAGNTIGPNQARGVPEPAVYRAPGCEIYDEGRFTPVLDGRPVPSAKASWQRAGRAVTINVTLPAGGALLTGLPFPPAAETALLLARYDAASGGTPAQAVLDPARAAIRIDRGAGRTLTISGTYTAV